MVRGCWLSESSEFGTTLDPSLRLVFGALVWYAAYVPCSVVIDSYGVVYVYRAMPRNKMDACIERGISFSPQSNADRLRNIAVPPYRLRLTNRIHATFSKFKHKELYDIVAEETASAVASASATTTTSAASSSSGDAPTATTQASTTTSTTTTTTTTSTTTSTSSQAADLDDDCIEDSHFDANDPLFVQRVAMDRQVEPENITDLPPAPLSLGDPDTNTSQDDTSSSNASQGEDSSSQADVQNSQSQGNSSNPAPYSPDNVQLLTDDQLRAVTTADMINFVVVLVLLCGYSYLSVKNIMVPALYYLLDSKGRRVSREAKRQVSQRMSELLVRLRDMARVAATEEERARIVRQYQQQGKEPMFYCDFQAIAKAYPEDCVERNGELLSMCIALNSGLRACSVASIQLKHIKYHNERLRIKYEVYKGCVVVCVIVTVKD